MTILIRESQGVPKDRPDEIAMKFTGFFVPPPYVNVLRLKPRPRPPEVLGYNQNEQQECRI
jgi:hypothetical protein